MEFVLEAAKEALIRYGNPEIENSDQGIHYTSPQHIALFKSRGTKISMDGRGRRWIISLQKDYGGLLNMRRYT